MHLLFLDFKGLLIKHQDLSPHTQLLFLFMIMLFKLHIFVYASVGLELEMIELEVSNMAYKLLFIYYSYASFFAYFYTCLHD